MAKRKKSAVSKITVQHQGKKIKGIDAFRIKEYKKRMKIIDPSKSFRKMSVTEIKNEAKRMIGKTPKDQKEFKNGKWQVITKNKTETWMKTIENWDILQRGSARQQAAYQQMLIKEGKSIWNWIYNNGITDYNISNMSYIDPRTGQEKSFIEEMENE